MFSLRWAKSTRVVAAAGAETLYRHGEALRGLGSVELRRTPSTSNAADVALIRQVRDLPPSDVVVVSGDHAFAEVVRWGHRLTVVIRSTDYLSLRLSSVADQVHVVDSVWAHKLRSRAGKTIPGSRADLAKAFASEIREALRERETGGDIPRA